MSLKPRLLEVYGHFAQRVFDAYSHSDPIHQDKEQYWTNVCKFLDQLHNLLYMPSSYQYSLDSISPEQYYFVVQVCILDSFELTDRIKILNDKTNRHCKRLCNTISHEMLHDYLSYLREIRSHKHYRHQAPVSTPVVIPHSAHIVPPVPHVPQMWGMPPGPQMWGMPPVPPMWGMPPSAWVQPHGLPPSAWVQPHGLPPLQATHPVPTASPIQAYYKSHAPSRLPDPPKAVHIKANDTPRPKPPLASTIASKALKKFRTKNWGKDLDYGKPKPPCNDKPEIIDIPTQDRVDTLPTNFYTVFGQDSKSKYGHLFKRYNSPSTSHEVPNLHPVPNFPPPPTLNVPKNPWH